MDRDRAVTLLQRCLDDTQLMFTTQRLFKPPSEQRARRAAEFSITTLKQLADRASAAKRDWDDGNPQDPGREPLWQSAQSAAADAFAAAKIAEDLFRVLRYDDGETASERYRLDLASQVEAAVRATTISKPYRPTFGAPRNASNWRPRRDDDDCHYCGPTSVCDC